MQSLFSTLFGNRLCPHCNGEIGNDLSFHQHLFWLEEKKFPELFKLAEDISVADLEGVPWVPWNPPFEELPSFNSQCA